MTVGGVLPRGQFDGETSLCEPVVTLTSIRGAGCRQASRVVVASDMWPATWVSYQTCDGDEVENRVFYTVVTRARDELALFEPLTRRAFQWPRPRSGRGA